MKAETKNSLGKVKEIYLNLKRIICDPQKRALCIMAILTIWAGMKCMEFGLTIVSKCLPEPSFAYAQQKEDSAQWIETIRKIGNSADKPRPNPFKAFLYHMFGERGYVPDDTKITPNPRPTVSNYAFGPGDTYIYSVTEDERELLVKVVCAEAGGESIEGQVAVAAVALNRMNSDLPEFRGKTLTQILTDENQFASTVWVTKERIDESNSRLAVEFALRGWDPTKAVFPDGAKFFYNPNGNISSYELSLREGVESLTIGNHVFHDEFND